VAWCSGASMMVGLDGLVQVGGTVWHLGGVDGRANEGFCFGLTPGDGWRIEVVVNIGACAQGASIRCYLGVGDGGGRGTMPHLFF
jgi:hypothetical protein